MSRTPTFLYDRETRGSRRDLALCCSSADARPEATTPATMSPLRDNPIVEASCSESLDNDEMNR